MFHTVFFLVILVRPLDEHDRLPVREHYEVGTGLKLSDKPEEEEKEKPKRKHRKGSEEKAKGKKEGKDKDKKVCINIHKTTDFAEISMVSTGIHWGMKQSCNMSFGYVAYSSQGMATLNIAL